MDYGHAARNLVQARWLERMNAKAAKDTAEYSGRNRTARPTPAGPAAADLGPDPSLPILPAQRSSFASCPQPVP